MGVLQSDQLNRRVGESESQKKRSRRSRDERQKREKVPQIWRERERILVANFTGKYLTPNPLSQLSILSCSDGHLK